MSKQKVVVGMSGGVDSSVTAWLLKEQGYDVVGLFMKNWEDDDDGEYCSTRQDWIDVVSVADLIGIDVEAVNFAAEYKDRVFAEFLREYSAGRTPNPDVLCNAEIKFKAFLDHAMSLGAETIATGHYARVRERDGLLRAAQGARSDQGPVVLPASAEPGAVVEDAVSARRNAEDARCAKSPPQIGLPNAKKKDSTGICFIGERPFREFLNRYLPTKPGPMKTPDGKTVGEHVGLAFYTFGQRKGIGIGGAKERQRRAVVRRGQGHGDEHAVRRAGPRSPVAARRARSSRAIRAGSRARRPRKARRAARRRATGRPMRRARFGTAADGRFELHFDEAQWAVTPGQSAVLYEGDVCLGGGIIEHAATALPAAHAGEAALLAAR